MMQAGDRVQVKGTVEQYGGRFGCVFGEDELVYGRFYGVSLDGDGERVAFRECDLLPVEVVVLKGKCHHNEYNVQCIGNKGVFATFSAFEGDDIRVTIERVKKEG